MTLLSVAPELVLVIAYSSLSLLATTTPPRDGAVNSFAGSVSITLYKYWMGKVIVDIFKVHKITTSFDAIQVRELRR